jgi:hypothetical protein
MPQRSASRSNIVIFCAVIGGFALSVLLSLFFGGPDRGLGIALVFVGLAAVLFAGAVSDAKQTIGERWPLWPGKNTLRPLTVRLWGGGVVVLGLAMAFGV